MAHAQCRTPVGAIRLMSHLLRDMPSNITANQLGQIRGKERSCHPKRSWDGHRPTFVISRYVYLLGILEINLEVFFAPLDARVLVGGGVREAINLTRQAPDDTPEVGALAVLAALRNEPKHTVS